MLRKSQNFQLQLPCLIFDILYSIAYQFFVYNLGIWTNCSEPFFYSTRYTVLVVIVGYKRTGGVVNCEV
jgi:hypothetical protein